MKKEIDSDKMQAVFFSFLDIGSGSYQPFIVLLPPTYKHYISSSK